jgi:hypothetical protein
MRQNLISFERVFKEGREIVGYWDLFFSNYEFEYALPEGAS